MLDNHEHVVAHVGYTLYVHHDEHSIYSMKLAHVRYLL
jgi:hypothetical protein